MSLGVKWITVGVRCCWYLYRALCRPEISMTETISSMPVRRSEPYDR